MSVGGLGDFAVEGGDLDVLDDDVGENLDVDFGAVGADEALVLAAGAEGELVEAALTGLLHQVELVQGVRAKKRLLFTFLLQEISRNS